MEHITPEQKKILRRIRTVSDSVKAIIYGGNLGGAPLAMQFNADVKLYGLWEALLYVEGYEEEGKYEKETASKAVNAVLFPELEEAE